MRITIETTNWDEISRLITVLKSLKIQDFKIVDSSSRKHTGITKGDKSIDPKTLFGIWKENPRNISEIREKSWKRNWEKP